ncbi:unnamed protein product [Pleuronectes platessa]|uniref:Uncharacterized protein n=1 Tax=Pleuronectes platessa TaxID=8262 RepID=A0A9N7USY9_PLEPL|nr:unnamed protein product [Pleuronectes platessa]
MPNSPSMYPGAIMASRPSQAHAGSSRPSSATDEAAGLSEIKQTQTTGRVSLDVNHFSPEELYFNLSTVTHSSSVGYFKKTDGSSTGSGPRLWHLSLPALTADMRVTSSLSLSCSPSSLLLPDLPFESQRLQYPSHGSKDGVVE